MRWRTAVTLALILFASAATPQTASLQPPVSTAEQETAEQDRLDSALLGLAPQRPGTVDAYVVAVALDSDAVFGREARGAGEVLRRRYGANGRTMILAGSEGAETSRLPRGTPASLAAVLARIAELMDEQEDVLLLYTTSHGTPLGLSYRHGANQQGLLSPKQMRALLEQFGFRNRLLILNACFSGIFVQGLQTPGSVIVTAAARDRTSFGCTADNDWTFFGDALINRALRKPQSLGAAFAEATGLVASWEGQLQLAPSRPQIYLGASVAPWLGALERRIPSAATEPVGRPAVESGRAAFTGH